MAKKICISPVFMALQGNFNATDEHGHKETLRFRETAWGTKSFGLGENPKRNYETNPLSLDEKAARSAFKSAAEKCSTILANSSLRATWAAAFKEAKAAGTTKCNTLNGFIIHKGIKGLISEDNTLVEG